MERPSEDGCSAGARGGGKCITHGGGRRCREEGCSNGAASGGDKCITHGGGLPCTEEGCDRKRKIRGLCAVHAGVNKKSLCSVAACFAKDVGGGKCKSHGGRATCTKEGCDRKVAARGVCRVHDESAPRCEEDGCDELARARGRCRNHGGYVNRDCGRDGCAKHALSGSEHCRAHGGGKRCQREGLSLIHI